MDGKGLHGIDPLIGKRIREYHILSKIGEGGMGAVYKAYHEIQKQTRALKVLKKELMADETFVSRTIREAQILEQVDDISIPRFFESFRHEDGTLFIAMEYVEGERLDQRLQSRGPLPCKELVPIFRHVCAGLAKAHSLNVVHRDLSPDNIVLVQRGEQKQVKILDFGIAKRVSSEDMQQVVTTQVGVFIGKYRYCSPEQLQVIGEDRIDERSDIYSLGVIMYEMLTGTLPFDASDLGTFLDKKLNQAPVPLRQQLLPGVKCPSELEKLIHQMLERDRERRPENVQRILATLDRIETPWLRRHWKATVSLAAPALGMLLWYVTCLLLAGTWPCMGVEGGTATIIVDSRPSGANIYLDRILQSETTPHIIRDLMSGKGHLLELKKQGYEPWSEEVTLRKNETRPLHAELHPQGDM